jgi:hypothetical protein
MFGRKNTQGNGRYSRLTPQKVLHICERSICVIRSSNLGSENEISRQEDGFGSACADAGRHCHACDCGIHFLFALNIFSQSPSALSLLPLKLGRCFVGGHQMKQVDYVRMAEKCAREADRMPPGPEREELLKKVKLFESYAKLNKWIASPGLQPPN